MEVTDEEIYRGVCGSNIEHVSLPGEEHSWRGIRNNILIPGEE